MKKIFLYFGGLTILVLIFAVIWDLSSKLVQANKIGRPTKGEILIMFKNEVNEDEALATLDKFNLKAGDKFFRYDYVSLIATEGNLADFVVPLRKLSIVKNAEIIGENRGAEKPWIVVDFVKSISRVEIAEMIKPYKNLIVEPKFYTVDLQKVPVPSGKEEYFAKLLQLEPNVKYATVSRNMLMENATTK